MIFTITILVLFLILFTVLLTLYWRKSIVEGETAFDVFALLILTAIYVFSMPSLISQIIILGQLLNLK